MCLIIILCLCICLRVGLSCRQTADSRDSTFPYDRHESHQSASSQTSFLSGRPCTLSSSLWGLGPRPGQAQQTKNTSCGRARATQNNETRALTALGFRY